MILLSVMNTKYITVDTTTLSGLKKAEWYHARGYKQHMVGLTYLIFSK